MLPPRLATTSLPRYAMVFFLQIFRQPSLPMMRMSCDYDAATGGEAGVNADAEIAPAGSEAAQRQSESAEAQANEVARKHTASAQPPVHGFPGATLGGVATALPRGGRELLARCLRRAPPTSNI